MTGAAPVRWGPSPWPVYRHRLAAYARTWRGSVFSSFVIPVMLLLGIGLTVGSYVDSATLGMPYADYIAPGVLASTVLQVAVAESTYPIMASFVWDRIYQGMRASPLQPADLVGGELLFVGMRTGTVATGFLVVMLLFGTLASPWAPAAILAALLLGVATAGPVLAFSSSIRSDSLFAVLNRFAVIPMTLFAGVFFPIEQLPLLARWVAYVTPLWHGVELCRAATVGTATALGWPGHVAALLVWAVPGYLLARRQYARRLTD